VPNPRVVMLLLKGVTCYINVTVINNNRKGEKEIMTKVRMTKKLVAMATTMMMLAAMVLPVSAATGSITVHKMSGTSIAHAEGNFTGEENNSIDSNYSPLEGAGFTLYLLNQAQLSTMMEGVTATRTITSRGANADGSVTFNFSAAPLVVTIPGAAVTSVVAGDTVTELTTDSDGKAVWSGLADGYYVLVETDTPDDYMTVNPSLIRMPMTSQSGVVNRDVHVYPKNISDSGIAIKDIGGSQAPVTHGQVVPFELKAKFQSATVGTAADLRATATVTDPIVATDYGTAKITESFSSSFALVPDSAEVFLMNAAGVAQGAALTPVVDYTVTGTGAVSTDYVVELTPAGINKAIAASPMAAGFMLKLNATYVGTPGITADGAPNTITNKMSVLIERANERGTGLVPEIEDEIFVPSISIIIEKKNSAAQAMQDVKFQLATTPTPTQPEHWVTAVGSTTPLVAITNEDGLATFSNLPGYTDLAGAKFYLIEIETNAGYQLDAEPRLVTFLPKQGYIDSTATLHADWFVTADNNWAKNVNITERATVTNYLNTEQPPHEPGFSLPLTGGAGTLAFTAIGIIVMLGAAGLYVHGKKRNAAE